MASKPKSSYTSKGERNNVNRQVVNSLRVERKNNNLLTMMNKLKALEKGFNPNILVPNIDSKTNRKAPLVKMPLRKYLAEKFQAKHKVSTVAA